MAEEYKHIDISELVKILNLRRVHRGETVLVLGSRAGGLFRSKNLYETLKSFSSPNFYDLPRIQQFAQCYYILNRRTKPGFSAADIYTILTNALEEINLTEADLYLAELVKSSLFDTIITTNIDNIVEEALASLGMREGRDFDVLSLPSMRTDFRQRAPCLIIKVFGELTTRDYTIRRSAYLNQNPGIKTFLEELLARDILAIGLDPVWDAELYQAIPPRGNSFWFINEEALNEDSALFHIGEARNYRPLVGEEGSYQRFVEKLWERFFSTFPETIQTISSRSDTSPTRDNTHELLLRELQKLRDEVRKLKENKPGPIELPSTTPLSKEHLSTPITSQKTLKIVLSYVPKDKILVNKLIEHMEALKYEGLVVHEWNSSKIQAGQNIASEIDSHLADADIILLLVSAGFLASHYIYNGELKRALEMHEKGKARVIPVILRPVDWKNTPFGTLKPLPTEGKPMTEWENRDKAALDIVEGIRQVIQELRKQS